MLQDVDMGWRNQCRIKAREAQERVLITLPCPALSCPACRTWTLIKVLAYIALVPARPASAAFLARRLWSIILIKVPSLLRCM